MLQGKFQLTMKKLFILKAKWGVDRSWKDVYAIF